MTTLQVRLLRFLMLTPETVFTRAEILKQVWPQGTFVSERTVDVHVAAVRKAVNQPGKPDLIRTIRGRGYALDAPETECAPSP